jgi:hypothetical protein
VSASGGTTEDGYRQVFKPMQCARLDLLTSPFPKNFPFPEKTCDALRSAP